MALDIIPLQIDGKVINIIEEDNRTIFVFRFYNKDGINITPAQVIYSDEEEQIPELSTQIYYGVYIEPYEEDGEYIFKFEYLDNKYIAIVAESDYNNLRAGSTIEFTNVHLGTDTSDATATANDILYGKTAYADGEKLTGTIVGQSAQTITPTTIDQVIPAGKYLEGNQTIKGDANLVPENIVDGVTIFGVLGTYGHIYPPDTPTDALLFYSENPFTVEFYNNVKRWDGIIYYSVDNTTWSEWDGSAISSALIGNFHCIYLRGKNNTYITGANWNNKAFILTGTDIYCKGNIEKLLDYENTVTPATYTYQRLFYQCPELKSAPSLPRTALVDSIYRMMFADCTKLEIAPELPATNFDSYTGGCYYHMFRGCTSLIEPPALNHITTYVQADCFNGMFKGCSSLEKIPALPNNQTAYTRACMEMFSGCTKIKISETQSAEYPNAYKIPFTNTSTNNVANMFANSGGTFTGTPELDTTYYTSNTVISAT